MKRLIYALAGLMMAIPAMADQTPAQPNPMREHRAIWMSPMLGSWPGGTINQYNLEARLKSLDERMQKLAGQGINTIYYHVRAHCDAAYYSSYEPISGSVSGSRGAGTCIIDPFAAVIEAGHKYGIEVYAWVNPYRYSTGKYYGSNPLNYEVSHPDWLLVTSEQIILNPAIPEVQQRVKDICAELATNYDIDGMIMDDYFYHSSTKLALDKSYHQAYLDAGGTIENQEDWRRENVNQTMRNCRAAVKSAKPYATYAIGPAGKISPDNIADYGLTPGPCGDMNYKGLYADPIRWLYEGLLDFLSPQVYWISDYDRLVEWYSVAVPHFGRHLYPSVDCSRIPSGNAAEYLRQIEFTRSHVRHNESGVVFFDLGSYISYSEKDANGDRHYFGDILKANVFPTVALAPMRSWEGKFAPVSVSAPVRNGDKLTWQESAEAANRRYAVYAVPAGTDLSTFTFQEDYLVQACYKPEFTITDSNLRYGVAVYDRYGNLYGIRFENSGNLAAAPQVAVVSPANGTTPLPLFNFEWTSSKAGRYVVEVARDSEFNDVVGRADTDETSIACNDVASLTDGEEYFWRVWAFSADCEPGVTPATRMTAPALAVTSPVSGTVELPLQCTIEWTAAAPGTIYELQISSTQSFDKIVFSTTTDQHSFTMPTKTLESGRRYYARVCAVHGRSTVYSPAIIFSTVNITDYTAPALLNPAQDGAVLHSNERVKIEEWDGMSSVSINIAETEAFSGRNNFLETLQSWATEGKLMGEVKVNGKNLVDGKTYYIRVRASYGLTTTSGLNYTPYGPTRSFVYSSAAGVDAVETTNAISITPEGILTLPQAADVKVYDLAGRLEAAFTGVKQADLSNLCTGVHIIKSGTETIKWAK